MGIPFTLWLYPDCAKTNILFTQPWPSSNWMRRPLGNSWKEAGQISPDCYDCNKSYFSNFFILHRVYHKSITTHADPPSRVEPSRQPSIQSSRVENNTSCSNEYIETSPESSQEITSHNTWGTTSPYKSNNMSHEPKYTYANSPQHLIETKQTIAFIFSSFIFPTLSW